MSSIKKNQKILRFGRETLRTLQSKEIAFAVGGIGDAQGQGASSGRLPGSVDSGRPICCKF